MTRHLPTSLACLATTLLAACASAPPAPAMASAAAAAALRVEVPGVRHPEGETAAWWFRQGASQAAARGAMQGRAKNVILFVGDGMSLPTVAMPLEAASSHRVSSGAASPPAQS